jgi:hypothetical protein
VLIFVETKTKNMITTNTLSLTEKQEDNFRSLIESEFTKQFTSDWNHFSFEGTRLNFKSMRFECVHEIHTECGLSFWGTIELNEKKKGLKRTIKFIEQ